MFSSELKQIPEALKLTDQYPLADTLLRARSEAPAFWGRE